MRLDLFLWQARLARTRSRAQALIAANGVRIDGRRVDKAAVPVTPGNTLAFAEHGHVRVIRIAVLPLRRGPPAEARQCYIDLMIDGAQEQT